MIPELDALIMRNPHRERLRGQLILALYRSQRQAEALEAYAGARRMLVQELGVEPSPALQRLQQAILQQDPSLEPATPPPSLQAPRLARNRRRLIVPLAAALALGGLALGLFLGFRGGKADAPHVLVAAPAGSLAVIDTPTGELVDAVPLEPRSTAEAANPQGVAVGYGAVWVTDGGRQSVIRIDPKKRNIVKTIGIGTDVRALATGFGSLWVAGGNSAAVTRIDPGTDRVTATIPLGSRGGVPNTAFAITAGAGSIWTTAGANAIARIDPATNHIIEHVHVRNAYSLTANNRFVWVGTWVKASAILRLDPDGPQTTVDRFAVLRPGSGIAAMRIHDNSLWAVVANGTTQLFEYDATTGEIVSTPDTGRMNSAIAITDNAVWISDQDGYVARLDLRARDGVGRINVHKGITWIAAGAGAIWITVPG